MPKGHNRSKPAHLKVITGTNQPCRETVQIVQPLDGEPARPKWLTGPARRAWDTKVECYEARGQSVAGCEDALAQYCALEAELIAMWRKKLTPPVAMINAHRIYANEFYDTPAAQHQSAGKAKAVNRFAQNGRKPA